MNLWFWIIFILLSLLTVLWYGLIRRDVMNYRDTQVKILGEGNRHFCETRVLRFLRRSYAFVLFLIVVGFAYFFYSL